jgi:hypothetical protein
MLAQRIIRPQPSQLLGDSPAILGEALNDGINLSVWQRQLPLHIAEFADTLLALGEPLAESLTLEPTGDGELQLPTLAAAYRDLAGHAGFVADVAWLVRAFSCLVDARRIGWRLPCWTSPCARAFTSITYRCG